MLSIKPLKNLTVPLLCKMQNERVIKEQTLEAQKKCCVD